MKNNKFLIWIIIIVLVLAGIKIIFLSPKEEGQNNATPGAQKGMPSPVTIYVVKPQELNNTVFATGTILANEEAVLLPEIAGKVIAININEGNMVNKGDLLVKVNDADFQVQLKKLELQLKITEEKLNRQKQLLAIKGIGQEEYDLTLNQLYTQQADVEFVKTQIAKTELRAPFSGIIGLKYISEGAYVNTASHIASIEQTNPVKIDFSVPEKYATLLKTGQEISFTVPESKNTYKAKIMAIEPKIDLATRSVLLRARADNQHNELYVGAFAKIELPLDKINDAILIPTEAVVPVLKGKKVFICKNGKAQPQPIETGIRTDALIQVTSGLQVGDSVVTSGMMQLKPEAPLKIVVPVTNNKLNTK